jgi:hypothetical protein
VPSHVEPALPVIAEEVLRDAMDVIVPVIMASMIDGTITSCAVRLIK